MKVPFAVLLATIAEIDLAGAGLGCLSVLGRWAAWPDVIAALAPVWLTLSCFALIAAPLVLGKGWDRRILVALGVLGLATNLSVIVPEYIRPIPLKAPAASSDLRVITYNVWDHNLRPGETVSDIVAANADVVAIQELSGLPRVEQTRLLNLYPFVASCPGGCDIALFAKHPWINAGFAPAPLRAQIVWGTTLAPDHRLVTIVTTHYSWPFPPGAQAPESQALLALMARLDRSATILTGDFNLAPWTQRLRTQDVKLAPMVRRTRGLATWPAILARVNQPFPFPLIPIDQIYAGPVWRSVAVRRLPRAGSDHYGVIATLSRD